MNVKTVWRKTIAQSIYHRQVRAYKRLKPYQPYRAQKIYDLNKAFGKIAYRDGVFYTRALREFEAFIKKDAGFALAYLGLGLNFGLLSRFEEEASAYERAMRLDPGLRETHPWLDAVLPTRR